MEKRAKQRKEKLARLADTNKRRCEMKAVFGLDLVEAVAVVRGLSFEDGTNSAPVLSDVLREVVKTPADRAQDMAELFSRLVGLALRLLLCFQAPPRAPSPHFFQKV